MASVAATPSVWNYVRPKMYPKQFAAVFDPKRWSWIEASSKAGKAQPLDALIQTPDGPVRMGDIAVGQSICTPAGTSTVVEIYPQGEQDIYRVSFADGSATECTLDHLWEVHSIGNYSKVMSLSEILKIPIKMRERLYWTEIAVGGVEFAPCDVPLDPYFVGALIGDGGLTTSTIRFSNADEYIIERVRSALPRGYILKSTGGYDWSIKSATVGGEKIVGAIGVYETTGGCWEAHLGRGHGSFLGRFSTRGEAEVARRRAIVEKYGDYEVLISLTKTLKDLGLYGKYSYEKGIPQCYLRNTADVRWSILRGIMDTDGWVDSHGQPHLDQTSEQLAKDVQELVESLGGCASVKESDSNVTKGVGRRVYKLRISLPAASKAFSIPRKKLLCRDRRKRLNRHFRDISFIGRREAQCIRINSSDGLYLTDHCIITHNTVACIVWLAEQAMHGSSGRNYWWVAPVYDQAEIAFNRMRRRFPKEMIKTNESNMTIHLLPNDAWITFKSAEKPDNLYGEDVYAVVIDEASRVREEAFIALRSTLTATRGPARIIGNVKGRKNWFYRYARRAERGDVPDFAYHKITAYDAVSAGVLAADEIESARGMMPEAVFRELYEADASDDEGNPFGWQAIQNCTWEGASLSGLPTVAFGIDLARKRDYTVICGLDKTGRLSFFARGQWPWPEQVRLIRETCGTTPTLVDATGVGDGIVSFLQSPTRNAGEREESYVVELDGNVDGSRGEADAADATVDVLRREFGDTQIQGFMFTSKSKQQIMEGLAVALQHGYVGYPSESTPGVEHVLKSELESFEYVATRVGVRYSAPDGEHDDTVCAMALAVKCLQDRVMQMNADIDLAGLVEGFTSTSLWDLSSAGGAEGAGKWNMGY